MCGPLSRLREEASVGRIGEPNSALGRSATPRQLRGCVWVWVRVGLDRAHNGIVTILFGRNFP